MKKIESILIVFPDEWLQYSPSVLNLYKCCQEHYFTKLVYVDNGHFKNEGIVKNSSPIKIGKTAAYFWRKTLGYKFYKVLRLIWRLIFIKLFDKRYDLVIAIDSSGYTASKCLFSNVVYFSLEVEKDIYFKISQFLGIEHLIIQSEERRDFLIGNSSDIKTYYLQNAPILEDNIQPFSEKKEKRILYMGNIEFGYGLEQFINCIKYLDDYTLTLKGIKNERYYNWLFKNYQNLIESKKLIFDFNYVQQSDIINYVSEYYIGITGYDIELAKKSFNYFSSPAGKLFNYYAAGVPVIGINIIGLNSVSNYKTGLLIDEVRPENIKKAISDIELNYDTYSENCHNASKIFDFKKSFNHFINDISFHDNSILNFRKKLRTGHERSINIKRNIFNSFLIKMVSVAISFLIVPLTINYLNPTKYGIWLTLTSVIGWFGFFELGLGNGLRNKLAEAFAKKKMKLARTYISTSYAILIVIISIVYVIFLGLFPFFNWAHILNLPNEMAAEINKIIMLVFSFFCLQFVVKLISMVLVADQRAAISGSINTIASFISLIVVFILTKTSHGSLLWLSIGISVSNIIAPLMATIWFFNVNYKHLRPSFRFVEWPKAKELINTGFLFFIMQLAALILFSTDLFIIDKLYGPSEVTPYNISFKYFSLITIGFSIITAPLWTAYTDAYQKMEYSWIIKTTNKIIRYWFVLVLLVIFMLLGSNLFYEIWVGHQIKIPFMLSLSMAIWVLISTWTSIFGHFLNGVQKIRLSLYHSIAIIFINIPISIFFSKYLNLGSAGVIIGTCVCVLPLVFLHPIQYKKIINNKAQGIWNK